MPAADEDKKQRPRVIGRYVLFQEVAHGGMATVHIGRLRGPAGFARTVAIKRLHPPFARDPEFVSMFLDEARLAARIQHPNVVSVLDVVTAEGELFLVMDYIHGESLGHLFKLSARAKVPMSRRVLTTIMVGVLAGLDAAHEARNEIGDALEIVHRDVSPQNVLLGLDGVPRVLDFGVAKAALRVHWSTQSGQIKGKLGYMSPEQLATGMVDRRADIYSAGVILWEGLTGRRLFDPKSSPDVGVIVGRILGGEIEPPSKVVPTTPKVLDEIVLKALSRSREDRYATAREMALALERAQTPLPNRQIGEWVAQVAGPGLKTRAAELNQIERVELPRASRSSSDFPALRPVGRAEAEESGSVSVPPLPAADDPPPSPQRSALASGQDLRTLLPTPPPVMAEVDVVMDPSPDSPGAVSKPVAEEKPSPPAGAGPSNPPADANAPAAAAKPALPLPPPVVKRPAPPRPLGATKPTGPAATSVEKSAPAVAVVAAPAVAVVAAPAVPEPSVEDPKPTVSATRTVIGFAPLSDAAPAPPTAPKVEQPPPEPPGPEPAEASAGDTGTPGLIPEAAEESLPIAPQRLVWIAGAACAGLLACLVWGISSRGSAAKPVSSNPATSATTATNATATADPTPSAAASAAPIAPSYSASPAEPASASPTLTEPGAPSAIASRAATPIAAPAHPRPRTPPKLSCNPPYTTDSQGVRIPKRECFR